MVECSNLDTTVYHLSTVENDLLLGHVRFLGADFHVEFIRVKEGDVVEPFDGAATVVWEKFKALQAVHEGAYQTVELPGRAGRWVMCVFPYAE